MLPYFIFLRVMFVVCIDVFALNFTHAIAELGTRHIFFDASLRHAVLLTRLRGV